jgi:phenylpropionate dioxygenase-like ring-hydroxylating dioxygenase large terminal subunit
MSLDYIRTGFDVGSGEQHPNDHIMATGRVAVDVYHSTERLAAEREMFGRTWLNIAEELEIPEAGDWIVREIPIRQVSLIIVRGKDMTIRAFYNSCAHRGMRLAWEDEGRGGRFVCPYHAWMYDSTGALLNIPDPECFAHIDKKDHGLTAIACDRWEGFVFVNLDPAPAQTLRNFLGPMTQAIADAPFTEFPTRGRIRSKIGANWKLALEAQTEGYHAAILHARTVGKMIASKDNPYNRPLHWAPLGPHRSQSVQFNPDFDMFKGRHVQLFALSNATQIVFGADGPGARFASQPGVNRTQSNNWGNEQFALYPNFVMHVSTGGWFYHRFWPIDEKTTIWEATYHFGRVRSLRESFANQFTLAFNRDTLTEDNVAIEKQQVELASGARREIVFAAKSEMLCRHFAAVNDTLMGARGGAVAAE